MEKINLNDIKKKDISEEEKKENEEKSKKYTIILYKIPILLAIIIGLVYKFTNNNLFLIVFAIIIFIMLWGRDGNKGICPKCKKWDSVIWKKSNKKQMKKTITKEKRLKLFGKYKIKETKFYRYTYKGICKNCGSEITKEKDRKF